MQTAVTPASRYSATLANSADQRVRGRHHHDDRGLGHERERERHPVGREVVCRVGQPGDDGRHVGALDRHHEPGGSERKPECQNSPRPERGGAVNGRHGPIVSTEELGDLYAKLAKQLG